MSCCIIFAILLASLIACQSKTNELFCNENKANDHTHQIIEDENQNSPNLFTRKQGNSLGEFRSTSYGMFWAERVRALDHDIP